MQRRDDWPERLTEALEQIRVFVWGDTDCACGAALTALAMTGQDPAGPYRGRYTDYAEGLALLRQDGIRSIKHWADTMFARIAPAHAQRGDWALVRALADDGRRRFGLGVVDGPHIRLAGGGRLPRGAALIAWKVG